MVATNLGEATLDQERPELGLTVMPQRSSVLLAPVMNVAMAKVRLQEFQGFIRDYLLESKDGGADGGDFGVIPGAGSKKVLLKSGADKLCEVYGLYDEYEFLSRVEDWDRGLFDYELRCILKTRRDDAIVGSGLGSCSSFESKYRWRVAQRKCPFCGMAAIIRGKAEYGGGWLCFEKKGGCKAKFEDNDPAIVNQEVGRLENPDIADTKNTVLKMAKKRAKIDAVIGVTRSSGIFTQDIEESQPADTVTVEEVPQQPPATTTASTAGSQPPASAAAASSSSSGNGNGNGAARTISEAQGKRLYAIARDAGINEAGLMAHLKRCGYSAVLDVKRSEYDAICQWAQRGGE